MNQHEAIERIEETPSLPSISYSYWLGRPATIGDGFVGREAELKAVGRAFEDSRAVVISGNAGSGKSRLATEYAHQAELQGFWTTAGTDGVERESPGPPGPRLAIG